MDINLKEHIKIHNRYELELKDSRTGEIKQTAVAENVVLSQMWNDLNTSTGTLSMFGGVAMGTGTGTPGASDTGLFTQAFAYVSNLRLLTMTEAYPTSSYTWAIDIPASSSYIGALTEIGLLKTRSYYSGSVLWTHAMLQDSEGNPITVNKTDLDVLTITATVYVTFSSSSANFKWFKPGSQNAICAIFRANGVSFPFVNGKYKLCHCTSITYDGQCITSLSSASAVRLGTSTWTQNTKVLDIPSIRMATGTGNTTYYHGMVVGTSADGTNGTFLGGVVYPNTNVFPNQTISGMRVGTGDGSTDTFDVPIDFFLENTDKVYVDGAQLTRGTDYTIGNVNGNVSTATTLSNALLTVSGLNEQVGDIEPISSYLYPMLDTTTPFTNDLAVVTAQDRMLKTHNPLIFKVMDSAICSKLSAITLKNAIPASTSACSRLVTYQNKTADGSYMAQQSGSSSYMDYYSYSSYTSRLFECNTSVNKDVPLIAGTYTTCAEAVTAAIALLADDEDSLYSTDVAGEFITGILLKTLLWQTATIIKDTDYRRVPYHIVKLNAGKCYFFRATIDRTSVSSYGAFANEALIVMSNVDVDSIKMRGLTNLSSTTTDGYNWIALGNIAIYQTPWSPVNGDCASLCTGSKIIVSGSANGTSWTTLKEIELPSCTGVTPSSGVKAVSNLSCECDGSVGYAYYKVALDVSSAASERIQNAEAVAIVLADVGGEATLSYSDGKLVFTNPPAEGAIITMDADIDRPFKNSNFVIDAAMTLHFGSA